MLRKHFDESSPVERGTDTQYEAFQLQNLRLCGPEDSRINRSLSPFGSLCACAHSTKPGLEELLLFGSTASSRRISNPGHLHYSAACSLMCLPGGTMHELFSLAPSTGVISLQTAAWLFTDSTDLQHLQQATLQRHLVHSHSHCT